MSIANSGSAGRGKGMSTSGMKILVVDDTEKNLDAAKEAAKKFPEHSFEFVTSASAALARMGNFDGIITDCFFPPETGEALCEKYAFYKTQVSGSPAFLEVIDQYYDGDYQKARTKLDQALAVMEEGSIRKPNEYLLQVFESWGKTGEDSIKEVTGRLENLPPPELPYGPALILAAEERKLKSVLITNLHRHAGSYKTPEGTLDGMIVLLPLMAENIITIAEARSDSGKRYVGCEALKDGSKEVPGSWEVAITRLLAQ